MRVKKEICYCDICEKEAKITQINYPVVFHTEQTEGRSTEPYVSQTKLDVCDECLNKVCKINGYGAAGINTYKIWGESDG